MFYVIAIASLILFYLLIIDYIIILEYEFHVNGRPIDMKFILDYPLKTDPN